MTFSDFVRKMTNEEYNFTRKVLLRFFGFDVDDKVRYRNEEWTVTGACVANQYGKPLNALEIVIAKYRQCGNLLVQEKNKHLILPRDLNKIHKLEEHK